MIYEQEKHNDIWSQSTNNADVIQDESINVIYYKTNTIYNFPSMIKMTTFFRDIYKDKQAH